MRPLSLSGQPRLRVTKSNLSLWLVGAVAFCVPFLKI